MARKEYELSEADYNAILDACKRVAYLVAGGIEPISPQERANSAWQTVADKMGFVWDSVQPAYGKSERFFTAEESPHA